MLWKLACPEERKAMQLLSYYCILFTWLAVHSMTACAVSVMRLGRVNYFFFSFGRFLENYKRNF